jgi:uncharacterized surface protein with fasciclin (FAS1) repeats
MFKVLQHVAATATVAFAVGCGGSDNGITGNVVQQAQADARLSMLVEAVAAANLGGTLNGAGPFTVFAPTNDAFAALLQELGVTKEQLLADRALLTTVLTYHVVPGRLAQARLPVNTPITTSQGQTVSGTGVVTDQLSRTADIVQSDVLATNGIVHAIDRVILPRA